MTRAAAGVLRHLENSGIRYCVLHGWDEPSLNPEGDLDIACFPQELERLEAALNDRDDVACVQLIQHESTGYYFVLAIREGESAAFLKLDVATDFRRNGRVFLAADELLEGRRKRDGIWISSPRAEFSYLLVKKTLKGALPEHQKKRLRDLRVDLGREAEETADILLGKKLAGEVSLSLERGDWQTFERALPHVKRGLRRRAFIRRPWSVPSYWLSELKRIRRRLGSPTGLSMAVMGSDGAGKSTLARRLQEGAAEAFRASRLYHLRPGLLAPRTRDVPADTPHGKPPYSRLLSLLKLFHFALDYRLGHLLKVKPKLRRSFLVLFDRYYHDILVDPLRYRYGGPQWLARAAARFIPTPGLFLFLDVPKETLRVRKQELPPEEVGRQYLGYARLMAKLPSAVLLDGSLPQETVALHAREAILRYLGERYSRRRRAWFPSSRREAVSWLVRLLGGPSTGAPDGVAAAAGGRHSTGRRGGYALLSLSDGRGYLLPLGCRRAGARALELYNAQNLKARAAKVFVVGCVRCGIAPPLLPRVFISERGDGFQETPLFGRLEELLGRRKVSFAVSFGTPGAHRKPVIQAVSASGDILAYVKVGWNPETKKLVLREGEVLRDLESFPSLSFDAPRLLHLEEWNGLSLLVQRAPKGKTVRAPRKLAQYLSVLGELQGLHARRQRLQESAFWANILQGAARMSKAAYGGLVLRGIRAVEAAFSAGAIPFHLTHGDFVPWNAVWLDGKAVLFDWEYADREGPPGYDIFHFLFQTWTLLDGRSPAWIHDAVRESGACRNGIEEHLRGLDIGKQLVGPLFLLYLLDRLVFYGSGQWEHFSALPRLAALANLSLCGGRELT
jgi:thymidylate kinase